jgi:hypothetical protein
VIGLSREQLRFRVSSYRPVRGPGVYTRNGDVASQQLVATLRPSGYNVLIVLILLILVFGFGGYRMGPGIGYYGGGGLSLVLTIVLILLLLKLI